MYGIQYKALNNAINAWEWRWARGLEHKPLQFITASEAWAYKEEAFAGNPLSEVRVAPLKGVAA